MSTNPPTQSNEGRDFLAALRELMVKHNVKRITGYDDGCCWILFNSDTFTTNKEPDSFELAVEELPYD